MTGWAMIDGRLVPLSEATIPVTDPAVELGWAVFETLLATDGEPDRFDPHAARLRASASAAVVPMPDEAVLREEVRAVSAALGGRARVRIQLTAGGHRVVTARPLDLSRRHRPVRAVSRPDVADPLLPRSVKHVSRASWAVAVATSGVDEVLLFDPARRFTEGTTCAVLAVRGGALFTAPHDGHILSSTTCVDLLDRAARLGVEVVREGPPVDGPWDALYVASTTRDLAPVVELDGRALPGWDPVGAALAQSVGA